MCKLLLASASLSVLASAALAQTCTTGVTPNFAASVGGFGVINGQMYTPGGQPFTADGINIGPGGPSAATLQADFPGINFVRYATTYNSAVPLAQQEAYINSLTAAGIVVELEDHSSSDGQDKGGGTGVVYTGAQLAAETAWYAQVASSLASNPYVWFGTTNEPSGTTANGISGAAVTAWQQAIYAAIRGAGNNNPILIEAGIGGDPQTASGWALNPTGYANMTNVAWDLHYYGWSSNGSTNQATVNAQLATYVAEAQSITSADGEMPVIIGEYGNSTTGDAMDANGSQVIQAVQSALQSGEIAGATAWQWGAAGPGGGDGLTTGGNTLSAFGQTIAANLKTVTGGAATCVQSPVPTGQSAAAIAAATAAVSPSSTAAAASADAAASASIGAAGMTIDQVAAIAGAGNGDALSSVDATAQAVLAQGAAPSVATPVLTVNAPTGTMPTPAPVSNSTSFTASQNFQTIAVPAGNNTGSVTGAGNTITATGGIQTISVSGPGNQIQTGAYNDTITLASAGNIINGGGGTDTVILAYGGGTSVATNADAAAIAPLAASGNVLVAPAPGTGTLTIEGTLAANDRIDLTKALAGIAGWNHNPADLWNFATASASADGCTISVGGQVVVRIPGGAPGGQLGPFVTAQ